MLERLKAQAEINEANLIRLSELEQKVNFLDTLQKKYLNLKNKIGSLFSKNQLIYFLLFKHKQQQN